MELEKTWHVTLSLANNKRIKVLKERKKAEMNNNRLVSNFMLNKKVPEEA